jgi:predicted nucleotidyltransferase
MNSIIENNKSFIEKLCKENKVDKLYVYGSVLTDKFNNESDLDFIVTFDNTITLLDYADNYFSFLFSLEDLFQREIDLITEKSLRNPFFIKELEKTKQIIYGAKDC